MNEIDALKREIELLKELIQVKDQLIKHLSPQQSIPWPTYQARGWQYDPGPTSVVGFNDAVNNSKIYCQGSTVNPNKG